MKTSTIALIIFVAITHTPAFATIINIPDDYPTIQEGINASENGDTVLVQPGRYIENIIIDDSRVVLGSLFLTTCDTSYINSTIIDGDSSGSVIHCGTWGDTTTAIIGFKIMRGMADYGGGGINSNNLARISHNIICNNSATRGGGIFITGSPIIENNLIMNNSVTVAGAGIVSYGGGCTIQNNMITDNYSEHYGGGIHIEDSDTVRIINNVIVNNIASAGGGIKFHAEGFGGILETI